MVLKLPTGGLEDFAHFMSEYKGFFRAVWALELPRLTKFLFHYKTLYYKESAGNLITTKQDIDSKDNRKKTDKNGRGDQGQAILKVSPKSDF